MIISHEYKFVFIATPKTGTTSIHKALQEFVSDGAGIVLDKTKDGKHQTALDIRAQMGTGLWEEYFSFGFVRNPFDWILSWYNFRSRPELGDPNHPNHDRWTGNMSFEDFVINDIVRGRSPGDYLTDENGEVMVDFVGRYEQLDRDFDEICRRIGLPKISLPSLNISKKRMNPDKLFTPAAWAAAEERFRHDLELFGYTRKLESNRLKGRSIWRFIKDVVKSRDGIF